MFCFVEGVMRFVKFPSFQRNKPSFFVMSFEPQQEDTGTSPIIEAKSLLSNGDKAGAFAVLKKGAESGDVMACYDGGFMMIQGIGCGVDWRGGLELMDRGRKLEEETEDMSWKSNGSVSELFEPQSMCIGGGFSLMCLVLNDDLNDHISSFHLEFTH